jgi:hypothetical protein
VLAAINKYLPIIGLAACVKRHHFTFNFLTNKSVGGLTDQLTDIAYNGLAAHSILFLNETPSF